MKVRSSFLALGAFFVIAVGIAGCGSGVPGDAVVNVAGNPISTQAFNHWMYVAAKSQAAQSPGSPVIVPNDPPNFTTCVAQAKADVAALAKASTKTVRSECQQAFTALKSQVLDFLIKAYWYQADAAKLGIKVSDAEVQQQFDAAKKSQFGSNASGFTTFLSQTGQTVDDVVFRFRVNAILQKLIAKHSKTVTQADIQSYYNNHLSQFGTQETRNMKIVLATSAANAAAAKKALSSGQSWATVVKKYSTDPTTKKHGRRAQRRHQAAGGNGACRRVVLGAGEQADRPRQGPVRLLRVRGHEDHSVDAADARSGNVADQAAAQLAVADQRPDRGRQQGQERLAQPDDVRRRVRDGGLQGVQGAEDGHHLHRRRRRGDVPGDLRTAAEALARLDAITRRLRVECPWDREQDERSIVPHTVEESYELADAARRRDDAKMLDELGDVLFQVHFLALLLEERGAGDLGAAWRATSPRS